MRFARRRHWRRCAPVAMVAALGLLSCENEDAAGPSPPPPLPTSVDSDRAVLVALYESTDGPNWVDNENWLTDAPLGDWRGVGTYPSGRVSSLTLRSKGLSGTIPPELGDLGTLAYLDLHGNKLTGPIPAELGRLASLGTLSLRGNDLDGPIPAELGRLANLTYLDLSENALSGPIPSELGDLAGLTHLYLWLNNLTGTIPPELGGLANLISLYLWGNELSGTVPPSFVQLGQLRRFYIGRNGVCVPGTSALARWLREVENHDAAVRYCNATDVAALKSLYEAAGGPGWTQSSGWLGEEGVADWHGVTADGVGRVTQLDLTRNGLTGRLPAQLGALARMTVLRLGGNAISGRLPLSLTRLSLQEIGYADTGLCAPVETAFQTWLRDMSS